MISTVTYNGDGATRIFPVAFEIKGEEYTVVYVGGVAVADRSLYDIINNSIVFNTAPVIGTNNVEIVVASTTTEIADLNAPPSTIQTVLDNMADINAIVNTVIPNIDEILLADDNASIAATKALEASTSAGEALASKNLAVASASNASTSETNADTSEANALIYKNSAEASATTATTQAGIATTKAGEALTSATTATTQAGIATTQAVLAQGYASSIDPSNLVHKTGDETKTGIMTFLSSPIVPTPTTDMQSSTKKYADDLVASLQNKPCFSATRINATQSLSTGVFTKVQLKDEEFDTHNAFDSTTNYRFQPTVAGYYQIDWCGAFDGTHTLGYTQLYKNGAGFKFGNINLMASNTNTTSSGGSAIVYMNGTTDYLELYAYAVGSSLVIALSSNPLTYLSGHFIRS